MSELIKNFRNGCQQFKDIVVTLSQGSRILALAERTEPDNFDFGDDIWVSSVLDLMQMYAFEGVDNQGKIIGLITALYNGRMADYLKDMNAFCNIIHSGDEIEKDEVLVRKVESIRHNLTTCFWRRKTDFVHDWMQKQEKLKPAIVPLGYMEYGGPIVVPKSFRKSCLVQTDLIFYNYDLMKSTGFQGWIGPVHRVRLFVRELGWDLLEQSSPYLLKGNFVEALFEMFRKENVCISSDILRELLVRFPAY